MTKPKYEIEKLVQYAPKPFSPKFYELLARNMFENTTIVSGRHAYFHLNNVREYGKLDHLMILQVHPRLPREIAGFARELRGGRNVVVVDKRPTNKRQNINPFDDDERFYRLPGERFQLLDLDAAESMNGNYRPGSYFPDEFYRGFANIVERGRCGVLEGPGNAYHMRRLRRAFRERGMKVREVKVPPRTPEEARKLSEKGRIVVLDSRDHTNPGDWDGFYRADIDAMLYLESLH